MKKVTILFFMLIFILTSFSIEANNIYNITYSYDKLNRLIKVDYDNKFILSYHYDNSGNIIKIDQTQNFMLRDIISIIKCLSSLNNCEFYNVSDINGDNLIGLEEVIIGLQIISQQHR